MLAGPVWFLQHTSTLVFLFVCLFACFVFFFLSLPWAGSVLIAGTFTMCLLYFLQLQEFLLNVISAQGVYFVSFLFCLLVFARIGSLSEKKMETSCEKV